MNQNQVEVIEYDEVEAFTPPPRVAARPVKVSKRGGSRSSSPDFRPLTSENNTIARRVTNLFAQATDMSSTEQTKLFELTADNVSKLGSGKKQLLKRELCELESSSGSEEVEPTEGSVSVDDNPSHSERIPVSYDEEKQEIIELDRDEFNTQYKKLKVKKVLTTYKNQIDTGKEISNGFNDLRKVIQLVIGRTQSGKTGCMVEFLKEFVQQNLIPIENLYLITGLSSKDWEKQCKQRFPAVIHGHIYHNGQMGKFKRDVENKKNILILIDETHMACQVKQTMSNMFKELHWKLDFMMVNDIKIVQFSATPDGMLYALNQTKWPKEHVGIHIMEPGQGYFGPRDMLKRKQIFPYSNIYGRAKDGTFDEDETQIYMNIATILEITLERFQTPKYLLFRVRGPNEEWYEDNIRNTLVQMFSEEQQEMFDTENFHYYTMDGSISDLPKFLAETPKKFTFVMIKEKLKCAQTLEFLEYSSDGMSVTKTHNIKHNIGVMVERWTKGVESKKGNDSFVIQGFLGRLCGYEQHDVICFTNIISIRKYEQMWQSKFDPKVTAETDWNSSTTRTKCGKTTSRRVLNEAQELVDGISEDDDDVDAKNKRVPVVVDLKNDLSSFNKIKNAAKGQGNRESLIISCISSKPEYARLCNFITNPIVTCRQTSKPGTIGAFDRLIKGPLKAAQENKPYCLGLKPADKEYNNWQCFIDTNEQRLVFIVWCLDPELY